MVLDSPVSGLLLCFFFTAFVFVFSERCLGPYEFEFSAGIELSNTPTSGDKMATANANAAPGATRPVEQHVEFVVKVSLLVVFSLPRRVFLVGRLTGRFRECVRLFSFFRPSLDIFQICFQSRLSNEGGNKKL